LPSASAYGSLSASRLTQKPVPLVRRNSLQTQGKLGAKNFLMHAHKPFSKTLLSQASRQLKDYR
jgi:hypothetical protein